MKLYGAQKMIAKRIERGVKRADVRKRRKAKLMTKTPTSILNELVAEIQALRRQRNRLRTALWVAYSHMNTTGQTFQWQVVSRKRRVRKEISTSGADVTVGALIRRVFEVKPHEWDAPSQLVDEYLNELEKRPQTVDNHVNV